MRSILPRIEAGSKKKMFIREERNTGEGIRLTGTDKNRFMVYT